MLLIVTWGVSSLHEVYRRYMRCIIVTWGVCIIVTWGVSSVHEVYHRYMRCIVVTWDVSSLHEVYHRYMRCIIVTWGIVVTWGVSSLHEVYRHYMRCIVVTWGVSSLHEVYRRHMRCIVITWGVSSLLLQVSSGALWQSFLHWVSQWQDKGAASTRVRRLPLPLGHKVRLSQSYQSVHVARITADQLPSYWTALY